MNYKNSLFYLIGKIMYVKKTEYLSKPFLKKIQRKRFEKLVGYALKNSEFYKSYYGDYGITEKNYLNKGYNEFPFTNKKLIMDNFEKILTVNDIKMEEIEEFLMNEKNTRNLFKKRYQIIHTSGSSGKIGIFVYDITAFQTVKALTITRVTHNDYIFFKKKNLCFIGATDGHYAGVTLANSAPNLLFNRLMININEPLDEIIYKIKSYNPEIITGYSSGVHILAKLQNKGDILLSPKALICSGDPLTRSMEEDINKAFKIKPIKFYAASESICMGASKSNNIKLFEDFNLFEVLNEYGVPSLEGKSGQLILTNLYNYTQPLIRYKMNDELVLKKNDESDRFWNFATIKEISGRREDFLWLKKKGGCFDFIHPLVFVEFYIAGLLKFQLLQNSDHSFTIFAVINIKKYKKEDVVTNINKRVKKILEEKGFGDEIDFNIKLVDEIKSDKRTGKTKLIIPSRKMTKRIIC